MLLSTLWQHAVFAMSSSELFSISYSVFSWICTNLTTWKWSSIWSSASFCAGVTVSVLASILGSEYFFSNTSFEQNCVFLHHSLRLGGGKVGGNLPFLKSVVGFNCWSWALPLHLEAAAWLQNMGWFQENIINLLSNIWLLYIHIQHISQCIPLLNFCAKSRSRMTSRVDKYFRCRKCFLYPYS